MGIVCSLKTYQILVGYRGGPKYDAGALEVMLRLGQTAEEIPELAELDLNPLMVSQDGAVAVDARIRVERSPPALQTS
ncbi:MAG: acetate--CoA ligase family protein [Nitrososphaerota archaeon]|nr:acetate--CoA ligase family protein [Nitrososphaerota archaeon]